MPDPERPRRAERTLGALDEVADRRERRLVRPGGRDPFAMALGAVAVERDDLDLRAAEVDAEVQVGNGQGGLRARRAAPGRSDDVVVPGLGSTARRYPRRMWLLPLAAAGVAAAFGASLLRIHRARPRASLLLWTIALAMYAVGCLALAVGAERGFDATTFRVYWAFGAVLNVPFLAAGEIDLLLPGRRTRLVVAAVLVGLTLLTLVRTWGAPMSAVALGADLPSGKDVFGAGSPAHRLPQIVSIPAYLVLLAGTLWSAARMRGRPELRARFAGTLLIATGATVIAGFGSAFAALGLLLPFSVSILVGVAVMFLGFRRTVPRAG